MRQDTTVDFPSSIVLYGESVQTMHFMIFWHSYVMQGKMPEKRVAIAICDTPSGAAPAIGGGGWGDKRFLYGGVDGQTPLALSHPRASVRWLAALFVLREDTKCDPDYQDVIGEITWELLPKECTIRYPQYRFLLYAGSKHVCMSDFPFYFHRSDAPKIHEILHEFFEASPMDVSRDVMATARNSIVLSSIETVEF